MIWRLLTPISHYLKIYAEFISNTLAKIEYMMAEHTKDHEPGGLAAFFIYSRYIDMQENDILAALK